MLLVNKYTPTTLNDFRLPKQLTETIDTLIDADHINMLLVGGMGSGKSSMVHAIVRQYYGEHYNTHAFRQNVMYINNLHEQGISYYRSEVKIFCQTSSMVKSKKKIVVIDDLDLIPEQSQQAFRNCIDKYGHMVCFLSTCSNNQKVIESIQSRLAILKLPSITPTIMRTVFETIVTTEHIQVTKEARRFILSLCNSTIKTLINYIEKCKLMNCNITYDIAQTICSDIDLKTFDTFTNMVKRGDLNAAIHILYSIYDDGYSVVDILYNYFAFVKITPLLTETQKYQVVPFLCKYITVFHEVHESDIELALFTNNIVAILS
jgi:DNA polymerase III delta prime subunit